MDYARFTLANGLRVIHHPVPNSNTVTLNILYNVGARDEEPEKTGFAHLFEHLMFGGSVNIPDYDKVVEWAGGNNNAFTNNDYTNYYISVPLENAETAFWLESDRMLGLDFSENSLRVQQGVVVEEFKQRCHNAPFGMLWHHFRSLAYRVHPYRWPTIGLTPEHIDIAKLTDVRAFYERYYHPNNAVLCIGGALSEAMALELSEKWFGSIERIGLRNPNEYPSEPKQLERRFLEAEDLLPQNAVFMAFRTPGMDTADWPMASIYAELIGGTETSPLHLELVKKQRIFSSAESFYMKGLSEGLWVVYGILNDSVEHEQAEKALRTLMDEQCDAMFTESHLNRIKNQMCTRILFEQTNPMNRVQKLCFYENLGLLDAGFVEEASLLNSVTLSDLKSWALDNLKETSANVVYYSPKGT
jgi:predicted Zn-dependent peptidase